MNMSETPTQVMLQSYELGIAIKNISCQVQIL